MPQVPNWRADLNATAGPDRYVQHESITQFHKPAFSGTSTSASEDWSALNKLGQGLITAGNRGLDVATDWNNRFNDAVCQQKIAEYEVERAAKQRELSQRKGINALENGTGEDVPGVYSEASGWHAMKAFDLMENCNGAQRRYLTQYLDRAGGNFKTWAANYQDREQQVYEQNAFSAATKALVTAGADDPGNLPEYMGSLRETIGAHARSQGWSVAQADAALADSQQQVIFAAVSNAAAAGDTTGAVELFEGYAGTLPDQVREKLHAVLHAQASLQATALAATGNYNGALTALEAVKGFKGVGVPTLVPPPGETASHWNILHNNWGNLTTGQKTKADKHIYQAFPDAQQGAFGMFKQWDIYHNDPRRKVNTLEQLIHTWSPPNENDTEGIIKYMSSHTGIKRDQQIDFNDPEQLGSILYWMAQEEHEVKSRQLLPTREKCIEYAKAYIDSGRPQPKRGVPDALLAQMDAQASAAGTQLGARLWSQFGETGQAEKAREIIDKIEDPARRIEVAREFQDAMKLSTQEHTIRGQAAGIALWEQHQAAGAAEIAKISNPLERDAAEKAYEAKLAEAERARTMEVTADLARAQGVVEQYARGEVPIDAVLALQPTFSENGPAVQKLINGAIERGMGIPAVSNPAAALQAHEDMLNGMSPVKLRQKYLTVLSKKDLDAIVKQASSENAKYLAKVQKNIFDEYFLGSKIYTDAGSDSVEKKQVYSAQYVQYLRKIKEQNITTEDGLRRAAIELCMQYRVPRTNIFGQGTFDTVFYEGAQAARLEGAQPKMVVPDTVRDEVEAKWQRQHPGEALPELSDDEIAAQALINDPSLMRFFR